MVARGDRAVLQEERAIPLDMKYPCCSCGHGGRDPQHFVLQRVGRIQKFLPVCSGCVTQYGLVIDRRRRPLTSHEIVAVYRHAMVPRRYVAA